MADRRAHIRLAREADAGAMLAIYGPLVRETIISFEGRPPALPTFQQRIVETLEHHPWLVCERAGEVLGYAYAGRHRSREAYQWSVDTSVYVHARHRGRGIGKALYTSLLAALTVQGYYNAYAGIALPNAASVALHETLGYRPIGVYTAVGYKFGAWHDVGWWHYALRSDRSDPLQPLPPPREAGRVPAWDAALTKGSAMLRDA